MTPRLVMALVRRGGVALLACVALGWWTYYTDKANRAERAATETAFREERAGDRAAHMKALEKLGEDCLLRKGIR